MTPLSSRELGLREAGWMHDPGIYRSAEDAFDQATSMIARLAGADLDLVGDFVLPPPNEVANRDFQTLHIDFGVPLEPGGEVDLALYTALHIPVGTAHSGAATRLVPLTRLFSRRIWPSPADLRGRFARYGASHGRRVGEAAYVEGSLARIVEASDGAASGLPSVRTNPGFLCGMEFSSARAEEMFFAARGLPLAGVVSDIVLEPGNLLVFNNLVLAHGRAGVRQPGELRQWAFGHRAAGLGRQEEILEEFLFAFEPTSSGG
jgi:hypothetical protein